MIEEQKTKIFKLFEVILSKYSELAVERNERITDNGEYFCMVEGLQAELVSYKKLLYNILNERESNESE